jgi:KUP system potassium uptake protein
VVSIKYVAFVMRADNEGEGGVLALLALVAAPGADAAKQPHPHQRRRRVLVMLGLFGAALLYGDGVITPAISVLSAPVSLPVAQLAVGDRLLRAAPEPRGGNRSADRTVNAVRRQNHR